MLSRLLRTLGLAPVPWPPVPTQADLDLANIGGVRPDFQFDWLDVGNTQYNTRSSRAASAVRFPDDDASFDFVFATSVFTHLLPDAAARYLAESRRVLRPGGRLFAN